MLLVVVLWFTALLMPLWRGVLTKRCVSEDALAITDDPMAAAHQAALLGANATLERLCGIGRDCAPGFKCVDSGENPAYGLRHFDDVGGAFLTLLQCVTIDGWSVVIYQLVDATGPSATYVMIVLLLFVSFGVITLSSATHLPS